MTGEARSAAVRPFGYANDIPRVHVKFPARHLTVEAIVEIRPSRIKLLMLPRLPHWTSPETGTNAVDSLARGAGASL